MPDQNQDTICLIQYFWEKTFVRYVDIKKYHIEHKTWHE